MNFLFGLSLCAAVTVSEETDPPFAAGTRGYGWNTHLALPTSRQTWHINIVKYETANYFVAWGGEECREFGEDWDGTTLNEAECAEAMLEFAETDFYNTPSLIGTAKYTTTIGGKEGCDDGNNTMRLCTLNDAEVDTLNTANWELPPCGCSIGEHLNRKYASVRNKIFYRSDKECEASENNYVKICKKSDTYLDNWMSYENYVVPRSWGNPCPTGTDILSEGPCKDAQDMFINVPQADGLPSQTYIVKTKYVADASRSVDTYTPGCQYRDKSYHTIEHAKSNSGFVAFRPPADDDDWFFLPDKVTLPICWINAPTEMPTRSPTEAWAAIPSPVPTPPPTPRVIAPVGPQGGVSAMPTRYPTRWPTTRPTTSPTYLGYSPQIPTRWPTREPTLFPTPPTPQPTRFEYIESGPFGGPILRTSDTPAPPHRRRRRQTQSWSFFDVPTSYENQGFYECDDFDGEQVTYVAPESYSYNYNLDVLGYVNAECEESGTPPQPPQQLAELMADAFQRLA